MSDKLLTPAEVGERTGYTPGGLAVMRHRKEGPPFVQHRPRGRVMYREEDVDAWIAAAVKTPA
ncbi:helix-turn-helix transcriptional regulator [Tsukamurella pseudospumae]|uniref:Helix-turn-helix domain-containing protein n=2 Tax=Tsukamurella TaxID=2060 RepID=A0A138AU02_9ACTN|nr:helix-turn-helix domain-containing protein [Tsukamurella pseudospumae]KXP13937.1 hypothetical protein AXK60_22805 [Tsukamurella pseudospumae]